MLIGGLLVGPLNAYFYDWLHLNFDALWKRVFLEEVVKMPAVMYAVQNVSNVADGMGARASHEKVAANFPHCFKVALKHGPVGKIAKTLAGKIWIGFADFAQKKTGRSLLTCTQLFGFRHCLPLFQQLD